MRLTLFSPPTVRFVPPQNGGPDAPMTYAPDNMLMTKLCGVDNRMLLAQEIKRATRATHVPVTFVQPASLLAEKDDGAAADRRGDDLRSVFRWQ